MRGPSAGADWTFLGGALFQAAMCLSCHNSRVEVHAPLRRSSGPVRKNKLPTGSDPVHVDEELYITFLAGIKALRQRKMTI
jgi:hypothetical protein